MPWDLFISHASDDKEVVAKPLTQALRQAGLSVWIDEEEIALGDSLLDSIQRGMSASRFAIVLFSPRFFAKVWAKAELAGFFQRELTGKKVILPVYYDISHEEVVKTVPILADRKAISWSDGIEAVVKAVVHALEKASLQIEAPAKVTKTDTTPSPPKSLALLVSADRQPIFVEAPRIKVAETIEVELAPSTARQSAALAQLQSQSREPLPVAYKLNALLGRIQSIVQTYDEDQERWILTLREHEDDYGDPFRQDIAYNNLSADDLAEIRARRILLDETPPSRGDSLKDTMFELFVEGMGAPFRPKRSPFPILFKETSHDIPYFLAAARLTGVLWLRLSATVEQTLQLDLEMAGPTTLRVVFEGQRRRRYSNEPPPVLRVTGDCQL